MVVSTVLLFSMLDVQAHIWKGGHLHSSKVNYVELSIVGMMSITNISFPITCFNHVQLFLHSSITYL